MSRRPTCYNHSCCTNLSGRYIGFLEPRRPATRRPGTSTTAQAHRSHGTFPFFSRAQGDLALRQPHPPPVVFASERPKGDYYPSKKRERERPKGNRTGCGPPPPSSPAPPWESPDSPSLRLPPSFNPPPHRPPPPLVDLTRRPCVPPARRPLSRFLRCWITPGLDLVVSQRLRVVAPKGCGCLQSPD